MKTPIQTYLSKPRPELCYHAAQCLELAEAMRRRPDLYGTRAVYWQNRAAEYRRAHAELTAAERTSARYFYGHRPAYWLKKED